MKFSIHKCEPVHVCKCVIFSLCDFKENHELSLTSCLNLQLCIFVTAFSVPWHPQMKKGTRFRCNKIFSSNSHGNHPLVISTACLWPCASIAITTATAKNKDTHQFCNWNVSGIRIPVHTVLGFWPTFVQKYIPKIIKRTIYALKMLRHHCGSEHNAAEFNLMYIFALYAMQTGLLTIK